MKFLNLHKWNLTPAEAIKVQAFISKRVKLKKIQLEKVKIVAGVDVSVKEGFSKASIVALSFPSLRVVEITTHKMKTVFPYIPGLLSFREGPVILECVKRIKNVPDVFIFDGQGLAHPRKAGLACHLGVFLGVPSVGCAKSRLYGTFTPPGRKKGSYSDLKDGSGEIIGSVLRTRDNTKPLFVSPGHLIDIPSARKIVLLLSPKYRLPEPIRAAHKAASLSS